MKAAARSLSGHILQGFLSKIGGGSSETGVQTGVGGYVQSAKRRKVHPSKTLLSSKTVLQK